MKKKYSGIILSAALISMCFTACGKDGTETDVADGDRITPVIDQEGADPWVMQQDGMYYYTKTTGNTITICRSENLSDIAAGEQKEVFSENGSIESFWAPEIHYLDGQWYIYFAACTYKSDIHTMYVLTNTSRDPFEGEWTCTAMKGMDDKFAIDGTVLTLDDESYFIWSGWEGYENVQQNLYIARLISPTETEKEKILISYPEYDWEKSGTPLVNEGPQVIVKGDTVNLVYSASGSWTDDYCLGLLNANAGDNLCNPSAWTKREEPVFETANNVYGPGHNSFVVSPDGEDTYMIYHAARWQGAGWSRSVRMQPVEFDENGVFVECEPVQSGDTIPVPGGEAERLRGTADELELSDGLEKTEDESALTGYAVEGFTDSSQSAEWTAEVPEDGIYSVFVYAKMQDVTTEDDFAYTYITVNGSESEYELYPSEYYQPVVLRREMKKGKNEISVSFEALGGTINLDRIELMLSGEN